MRSCEMHNPEVEFMACKHILSSTAEEKVVYNLEFMYEDA